MISLFTAENIGRLVVMAFIAVAAVWTDRAITGRGGNDTDSMQVRFVQRVMRPADIVEATEPETVIRYRAPDSTRNECFNAPLWLDTLSKGRIGQGKPSLKIGGDSTTTLRRYSQDSSINSLGSAGLPYAITPTTNGRPSLSVGSRRVVLQSLSPRDGSALTYEYDVPRPEWKITAGGGLTAGSGFALGMSTAGLSHRTPVGWLSLEAGYGGVVTDRAQMGLLGRVSLRKTLYSW